MDPISAGLGVIGLGMQIFGGMESSRHAKEAAALQNKIAGQEQEINKQRQQQMELESSRQQLQNVRNTQRARSLALTSSTSQGAQFGSGLQGGYGQISGQSNTNALGLSQNLEIGRNIFGFNNNISGFRQQLATVQGSMAADQGWSNLGKSIGGIAGTVGNIAQSFGGGGGPDSSFSYGGRSWPSYS